jgi:hypothetical protein
MHHFRPEVERRIEEFRAVNGRLDSGATSPVQRMRHLLFLTTLDFDSQKSRLLLLSHCTHDGLGEYACYPRMVVYSAAEVEGVLYELINLYKLGYHL